MNITVILCTYNRSEPLSRALESVAALEVPDAVAWEVLVVDNNSNDQTRAVVADFCRRYPDRFRYLFEPQPGKSHALNAGIREAKGDILAFMDDDVTVEPTWLQNLTTHVGGGQWVGAGGRILPLWNGPAPPWLPVHEKRGLAPLVMFDFGPEPGELQEPPFGANMAFRKCVFLKYGGFRTDLGPRPGSEIRSEDTEFGRRLLSAGERLRYEPSAVVYHAVTENRLRKEYFLAWWCDKARADICEFGVPANTRFALAGVPLHLFRRLAVASVRWVTAFDPRRRFARKLGLRTIAAQIEECYRLSRAAKNRGALR